MVYLLGARRDPARSKEEAGLQPGEPAAGIRVREPESKPRSTVPWTAATSERSWELQGLNEGLGSDSQL